MCGHVSLLMKALDVAIYPVINFFMFVMSLSINHNQDTALGRSLKNLFVGLSNAHLYNKHVSSISCDLSSTHNQTHLSHQTKLLGSVVVSFSSPRVLSSHTNKSTRSFDPTRRCASNRGIVIIVRTQLAFPFHGSDRMATKSFPP